MRCEEQFLSRFGDAIDDRIAEILDELLDQRNPARPPRRLSQMLGGVTLILALAASILLRHNLLAAWTIWPTAATICLAIAWTRTRRS
jgi:fatty acid desaturase